MGLDKWSVVRTRAVDFGERERERERDAGSIARFSGNGRLKRERESFGSWETTHLNGDNSKPRHYRKLCIFKKMLSQ